jgi:hypothetical protein
VASNSLWAQLPAASPAVQADAAQELSKSLALALDRLENNLSDALFTQDDEANLLNIYNRDYREDSSQYRLARKSIKDLDAGELRRSLNVDSITDSEAQVYPAKLEVSAALRTLKRSTLPESTLADCEPAAEALIQTYQRVARAPEFASQRLTPPDQIQAAVSGIRQLVEVHQRLTETSARGLAPAPGAMITLDKHFWIIRYPNLTANLLRAIDSKVCLRGTGAGRLEIQEAELTDLGVPLLHPGATPLADARGSSATSGVLVYNPAGNKMKVGYVIDGVSYELKPGDSRAHAITAKSQITYNRGGTLGNATYKLTASTYQFAIQARGWQVNKATFSVLIDNAANGSDFRCEIDGKAQTIPAHQSLQRTSPYPIAIRFDQGNGQATRSKLLGDARVVTVGVAPGTTALDLFAGTSQDLAVQPAGLAAIASQSPTQTGTPSQTTPAPAMAGPTAIGRQSILPGVEDLQ